MFENNIVALGVTLLIALSWLRFNDFLAHKGWVAGKISRKIIHVGTGPIFVLCWLLFNTSEYSSILAAIVPLGITVQFVLVGLGVIGDQSAVEAMSRTGDRREILLGPLFYGIIFILVTIVFWRNSAIGISALMIMCGGDGLADISGSLFGKHFLPWSSQKTIIGSLTMFLGGFIFAFAMILVFINNGYLRGPISSYLLPLAIISFVSALVESLPFRNIDNITVPLVSIFLGLILF